MADIEATVWRLSWFMNGVGHHTDWTTHYDLIRNLREDYRRNWPGTGVEVESAPVSDIGDVTEMEFSS